MIKKEENLFLGSIVKPHGTKGSLLIRLRNIKSDEIKKGDWLFLEIEGLLVPFFITEFRGNGPDSVIVTLQQIGSENEARLFSNCEVFIPKNSIKQKRKRIADSETIAGYQISDKRLGYIGIAHDISGVSSNPLLRVSRDDKEWLIPVHEDIIIEIDDKNKVITIDAPEGLFDL